jgi:hypothetical protein
MPTSGALGFNSRAAGGYTAPIAAQVKAQMGSGTGGKALGWFGEGGKIEGMDPLLMRLVLWVKSTEPSKVWVWQRIS